MSDVAIAACLIGLGVIALLPRIFFRRGRLNARWWLTAMPFVVTGGALVVSITGFVEAQVSPELRDILAWPALAAACAGVALVRWTLATHARPVSLWHQADDRPDELVTWGPYAYVRHPFYASFLLILGACSLALPHPLTLIAAIGGWFLLDRTAAREERRLLDAFGAHYASYLARSSRFVPRVRAFGSNGRDTLRPPIAMLALLWVAATPVSAQEPAFSDGPPADVETTIDRPDVDPLRMPELRGMQPRREENGLFDAVRTGAFFGLGAGIVLLRDDAPADVLIGGPFGGAAGAATAYVVGFRNDGDARSLLGSLAGSAAGIGVAYALANAEVDGTVLMISSTALGAVFGAGISRPMDGI